MIYVPQIVRENKFREIPEKYIKSIFLEIMGSLLDAIWIESTFPYICNESFDFILHVLAGSKYDFHIFHSK